MTSAEGSGPRQCSLDSSRTSPEFGKVRFADAAATELLRACMGQLDHPDAGWGKVKSNASRTVYRGRIDGQGIYLKHFHSRLLVHRVARRLGSSDALREMEFMQYLSSQGVPTAPVLAARCHGGVEWLATRAVEPSVQGDLWHPRQLDLGPQGARRIRLATLELARMIGRMHAAGVIHRDLHCGNILVRGADDRPELLLMDLHRVRRSRNLSRRARAMNLAQLFHDRYDFTTRTQRLRFLTHYLAESRADGSLRAWQRLVEQFAHRHTRRQYAQRQRRVMGENKYFSPVRLPGGYRGSVVLASKRRMADSKAAAMEFTAGDWEAALADIDALFTAPGGEVVKNSPSSMVVRRKLAVGPNTVDVFIKRCRRKRAWKAPLDCFRPSRPMRAFQSGHALLARRVATALPLAAVERRIGPLLLDSILITEAVDAPELNTFLSSWLAQPARGDTHLGVAQQRQLAQEVFWQLGRMMQRLHDNNFAHRDLKSSNILVPWTPGQPPQVVLVDLDGLSHRRFLSMRRRYQGVMRLSVSLLNCPVVNQAGRLRMLLGYLRRPGSGDINFKPYWRMLEKWSARKLRQQIRSRRRRQRAARRPG